MVLTDLNSDPKSKKRKLEVGSESGSSGRDPKIPNIDSQISKLSVESQNDSGDGFDDDSDDDLFDSQAQILLSQSAVRSKYKISNEIIHGKAIVKEILNDSIILECNTIPSGDGATEQNSISKYYEIKSRPEWVFEVGDFIHSAPEFGTVPVLHSDTLLSCTNIAIAATCPRRAILTDRFRDAGWGSDPSSYRMVLGNYLHTLFQSSLEDAMKKRKITPIYLKVGLSG